MSLIHKFDYYTAQPITGKHIKTIISFDLEILSIEADNSGAIYVLIAGTFDQHQCINKDSELAKLFRLA